MAGRGLDIITMFMIIETFWECVAHVSYLHNVECVANMDLWTSVLAFLCVGGDSSNLRETAFHVFQPPMQKVHEICTI